MAIFKNRFIDGKCCEEDCPPAADEDACECEGCCAPANAEICVYEWAYEAVDNAKGCVTQYFRYATNVKYGKMTADGCYFTSNGQADGDVILEWKKVQGAGDGHWHYGELIASEAGCEHFLSTQCNTDGREVAYVVTAKNVQNSKVVDEEWVPMEGIVLQVGEDPEYVGERVDRSTLDCDCRYTNCPQPVDHDDDPSTPPLCYDDFDGDGDYEYYDCGDCEGCMDPHQDNFDPNATVNTDCCSETEEQPGDPRSPCCFEKHRKTPEDEGVSFPTESEVCCSHQQNQLGNC